MKRAEDVLGTGVIGGLLGKAASCCRQRAERLWIQSVAALQSMASRGRRALRDEEGQGTTEYAILVGVLVVIAIVAVIAFRGRIQELWTSIADSINDL